MLKEIVSESKKIIIKNNVHLIKPGRDTDHSLCDGVIVFFGLDFSICVGGVLSSDDLLIPNKLHYILFGGILRLKIKNSSYRILLGQELKDYYRNTFHFGHLSKTKKIRFSIDGSPEVKSIKLLDIKVYANIFGLGVYLFNKFQINHILLLRIKDLYLEAMYFNIENTCESQSYVLGSGFANWRESDEQYSNGFLSKTWEKMNEEERKIEHDKFIQKHVLKKVTTLLALNSVNMLFFSLPEELEDSIVLTKSYETNLASISPDVIQVKNEASCISEGLFSIIEAFEDYHSKAKKISISLTKDFSSFYTEK